MGSALITTAPTRARLRDVILVLASLIVSLVFLALIAVIVTVVAWTVLGALNILPDPDRRWPRVSAWAIVAIPIVALLLAFVLSRRAEGRTFSAQQQANRLVSLLLLVTMIGLLAAIGEAVAASLTLDSLAALTGGGLATVAGVGAAAYSHFAGAGAVLDSARARPADPQREVVLHDVVSEMSIAANVPPPRVYVIEDGTMNAMAVGTTARNASIAVTRGLLNRLDREQLQGVVAHEIGHIRNLDSRYGVYVAIMVGLVALITDGFLRMVVRAWQEGVFLKGTDSDDAKGAIAGLAAGVSFGVLLLLLASVLRVFAPIASLLVQAAVSRQREYLADATSVELTRNPTALSRALATLRDETDRLDYPNRGSQHLWFTSPFGVSEDGRWNLFATHPSLDDRIARLAELYPPVDLASSGEQVASPNAIHRAD